MSFFSKGLDLVKSSVKNLSTAGSVLQVGDIQVVTTALLAEGGYSYVYSAREVGVSARVFAAKKVLAQDEETRDVAEVETRCLQQFDGHPGFVRCFGAMSKPLPNNRHVECAAASCSCSREKSTARACTRGRGARPRALSHTGATLVSARARRYWMLLELCTSGSLIDVIYKKGKSGAFERRPALPAVRVLEIFEQVVGAVAHMHAQSPPVCHRDLKLENVLGTADGRWVLCDFGSATTSILAATRTRRETIKEEERIHKYSTLMYRAPEMVDLYRNQEVGPKADVWALGCILFALCFRDHPFAEESSLQILNARYTVPKDSPYLPRMHKLIAALLIPDPALRPAAADILAAVQRLRAAEEQPAAAAATAAKTATAAAVVAAPTPPPAARTSSRSALAAADDSRWEAGFDGAAFADFDAATPTPAPSAATAPVTATVRIGPAHGGGAVSLRLELSVGAGGAAGGCAGLAFSSGGDDAFTADFGDERGDEFGGFTADFGEDTSGPPPAVPAAPTPAAAPAAPTPAAALAAPTPAAAPAAPAEADEDDGFGEFGGAAIDVSEAGAQDGDDDDFGAFSGAAESTHKPFAMGMD